MTERWLSQKEVCAILGIAKRTFYTLAFFRVRKHYPAGRAVRYAESDVRLYQTLQDSRRAA